MSDMYQCNACGLRGSFGEVTRHQCQAGREPRKFTANVPIAGWEGVRLNPQAPFSAPFPQSAPPPSGPVPQSEGMLRFHCKYDCGHSSPSWEDVRRHEMSVHELQRPGAAARANGTVPPVSINGKGVALNEKNGLARNGSSGPMSQPKAEGSGFVPFKTSDRAPEPLHPPQFAQTPPVSATPPSPPQSLGQAPLPIPQAKEMETESESEQGDDDDEEESTLVPVLLTVVGPAAAAFLAVLLCMPFLEGTPEWPELDLDLDLFSSTSNATEADANATWSLLTVPRQLLALPLRGFVWVSHVGRSLLDLVPTGWNFTRHSIIESLLLFFWWLLTLLATLIHFLLSRLEAVLLTALPIFVIARLCGKYTASKVLAVVAAWFDLRIPIFLAAIFGYWGWSVAWPTILTPCVVWQLNFSRARARRRGESVSYAVPLFGPKAIRGVVNSVCSGQNPRQATKELEAKAEGQVATATTTTTGREGKEAVLDRVFAFCRRTWTKLTTRGVAAEVWDRVVPRWGGRMFNAGLRGGVTRRRQREHESGMLSGENAKVQAVLEGNNSEDDQKLRDFLVRSFDYLHVVIAVVVSFLLARAGCPIAAVPISSFVIYAECTIRKEKFARLDLHADRVFQVLTTPTTQRCDDCAQDLESYLRGADHRRCDVKAAWLNHFMTDILWPAYSEWIAAWLDDLIEYFVVGFGVTIDDDSRTIGDKPITLSNVWGRMGRTTKYRQVLIQENERWWPTGWTKPHLGDPSHYCIWDQSTVEDGQDQQMKALEEDLKKMSTPDELHNLPPTLEGWEWMPEGWEIGPWEYALDFPNSKKMLFVKSTWKSVMETKSCVRRRQWSRWMICKDDEEDDYHIYELFVEIDWKSSCNLRFQVKGIEVDLQDAAANLKTVFTFEFKKCDYDKDPDGFPNLTGLTMGLMECPSITFVAEADNYQVLGQLVAQILSWINPSLVSNIVLGVFTPPMRFMGQERTWEHAYANSLEALSSMHGYISFHIQSAVGSDDVHLGKYWYLRIQECRETPEGEVLLGEYCTTPIKINHSLQAYWGEVAAFGLRDPSQSWKVSLCIRQEGQRDVRFGEEKTILYTDLLERHRPKTDKMPRLLCGEWTDPLETLQNPLVKYFPLGGDAEAKGKQRHEKSVKVQLSCNVQPCDPRPLAHVRPGDKLLESASSLAPGYLVVMPVRCQCIQLVKKARLDISLCVDEERHNLLSKMSTSPCRANQSPIDPNVRGGSFNPEWEDEILVFPYITEKLERLRLMVEIVDCSSDVPSEHKVMNTVWAPLMSLVGTTLSQDKDAEFAKAEDERAKADASRKKESERDGAGTPASEQKAGSANDKTADDASDENAGPAAEKAPEGGAIAFCSPEFEDTPPPWPGKNLLIPDSPWYPWAQLMLVTAYRPDVQKELSCVIKIHGFNPPPGFQSSKWACGVYFGPDARMFNQRPSEQNDKAFCAWKTGPPSTVGNQAVWLGKNMKLLPVVEAPNTSCLVITLEENGKVQARATGTLRDIRTLVTSGRQTLKLDDDDAKDKYPRHEFELRLDITLCGNWDAAFMQEMKGQLMSGIVHRCPGPSKRDGSWEKKRLVLTADELFYDEPHLPTGRSAGVRLSMVSVAAPEEDLPDKLRQTMRGFRVRLRDTGREELFAYNPVAQRIEDREKTGPGTGAFASSFNELRGGMQRLPSQHNPMNESCAWVEAINNALETLAAAPLSSSRADDTSTARGAPRSSTPASFLPR